VKKVQKVYVGKANKCFCGCSGKWFDANNADDLTGFLKGIKKFNQLGVDNGDDFWDVSNPDRSEEHTSELQSRLGRPYAPFCLKKKTAHL